MNITSEYFESIDATIYQPKDGYRYGEDAIALAEFCDPSRGNRILEIGSGVGLISIILAKKFHPSKIISLEIQGALFEVLEKNIGENNLQDVIEPVLGDYRNYSNSEPFDIIVTNPPFYKAASGRISSDERKALSHHEIAGDINDLLDCVCRNISKKGNLYILYLKERKVELESKLKEKGFLIRNVVGKRENLILLSAFYE
ncbi:methyltransferase [bacterium]|nr:methyltransferase [bacterium]